MTTGLFTCDQTIARDRLQRRLDWMNPKTGIRRRLLDLFYDTGARWTWHTVLGLAVVVPLRLLFLLLMLVGVVLMLPALALAYAAALSCDLGEYVAGFPAGWAFARYRKVLRDRDDIIASGNTEP